MSGPKFHGDQFDVLKERFKPPGYMVQGSERKGFGRIRARVRGGIRD